MTVVNSGFQLLFQIKRVLFSHTSLTVFINFCQVTTVFAIRLFLYQHRKKQLIIRILAFLYLCTVICSVLKDSL